MVDLFTELFTATIIICIWSILYRENVFYRVVQNVAIGATFGWTLYISLKTLWDKTFTPLMSTGSISLLIVTIFGLLIWTRLIPGLDWLSRISIALLTGISMAIGVRGAIFAQIIKQAEVGSWAISGDPIASLNNIITGVFAFSAIVYFIYTREHVGAQGVISRVGRIALMVTFGAILGTFLMGNTSFSIGQIPQLIKGNGAIVSAIALLLIIGDFIYQRSKTSVP